MISLRCFRSRRTAIQSSVRYTLRPCQAAASPDRGSALIHWRSRPGAGERAATAVSKGFHTLSEFQAIRWASNALLDIGCYTGGPSIITDHAHADRRDPRRGSFCRSGRNVGANIAGDSKRDTVDIAEGSAPAVGEPMRSR